MNAIRNLLLEAALVLATAVLVLSFGGVHAWSWGVATALIFFVFFCWPSLLSPFSKFPALLRISWLLVLVLISFQVQIFSASPHATFQELLKWLAFGGIFIAVQVFPISIINRLFIYLAVLGAAVSVYALTELLSGHEHVLWRMKVAHQGFATGTFLNRNHFAGFLEICLGIQTGLVLKSKFEKRWVSLAVWGLMALITLLAFYKTGSRMGLLSFGIAAMAVSFLIDKKLALVLALAALVLGFFVRGELFERLGDLETLYGSSAGRFMTWQGTLQMASAHPFWGSGLGTFELIFPMFQPAQSFLRYTHAHQDYLELLAVLGIPAFLLLLTGFFALALDIYRRYLILEGMRKALFTGALLGLISFLIHGLADFNFAIPANHFLFLLVLSLTWRLEGIYEHRL